MIYGGNMINATPTDRVGERSWPSGQGAGVRILGSSVRSRHWAWFALEA